MQSQVESGLQLFARLRSGQNNTFEIDDTLFPNGIRSNDTIEISGDVSSGKTLLLTQYIAKFLLPTQCQRVQIGGCNSCVILINTDHHLKVSRLVTVMFSIVRNAVILNDIETLKDEEINSIVFTALDNLTLIDCYNNDQFTLTLHSLENIFLNNEKVALLAIDSISSFYWQHREVKGVCSMDLYIKNLIKTIQAQIVQFNSLLIYTRPTKPQSKGQESTKNVINLVSESINYKIQLRTNNKYTEFQSSVNSMHGTKYVEYTICEDGIKWECTK